MFAQSVLLLALTGAPQPPDKPEPLALLEAGGGITETAVRAPFGWTEPRNLGARALTGRIGLQNRAFRVRAEYDHLFGDAVAGEGLRAEADGTAHHLGPVGIGMGLGFERVRETVTAFSSSDVSVGTYRRAEAARITYNIGVGNFNGDHFFFSAGPGFYRSNTWSHVTAAGITLRPAPLDGTLPGVTLVLGASGSKRIGPRIRVEASGWWQRIYEEASEQVPERQLALEGRVFWRLPLGHGPVAAELTAGGRWHDGSRPMLAPRSVDITLLLALRR